MLGSSLENRPVLLMSPKEEELVLLNGCVVSACRLLAAERAVHMLEEGFWSRLLLVRFKGLKAGHAYCVWRVDGRFFGYDRAGGSFEIAGVSEEPVQIAEALSLGLEKRIGQPLQVERAEFVIGSRPRLLREQ